MTLFRLELIERKCIRLVVDDLGDSASDERNPDQNQWMEQDGIKSGVGVSECEQRVYACSSECHAARRDC